MFVLNGDWKVVTSGQFHVSGSVFYYSTTASDNETITSTGPLSQSVNVFLLYQEPNLGVGFSYTMPLKPKKTKPGNVPIIETSVLSEAKRRTQKPGKTTASPSHSPNTSNSLQNHKENVSLNGIRTINNSYLLRAPPTSESIQLPQNSIYVPQRIDETENFNDVMSQQIPVNQVFPPAFQQYSDKRHTGNQHRRSELTLGAQLPYKNLVKDVISSHENTFVNRNMRMSSEDAFTWKSSYDVPCTKPCGGGWKFPMLQCVDRFERRVVATKMCAGLMQPPQSAIMCNTHLCRFSPDSPRWQVGSWSQCDIACGGGIQRRLVLCYSRGKLADYERCSETQKKPDNTRACNTHPCAVSWSTGEWSKCSSGCGWGIRSRKVHCVVENNSITDDTAEGQSSSWNNYQIFPLSSQNNMCQDISKPQDITACYDTKKCPLDTATYRGSYSNRDKLTKNNDGSSDQLLERRIQLSRKPRNRLYGWNGHSVSKFSSFEQDVEKQPNQLTSSDVNSAILDPPIDQRRFPISGYNTSHHYTSEEHGIQYPYSNKHQSSIPQKIIRSSVKHKTLLASTSSKGPKGSSHLFTRSRVGSSPINSQINRHIFSRGRTKPLLTGTKNSSNLSSRFINNYSKFLPVNNVNTTVHRLTGDHSIPNKKLEYLPGPDGRHTWLSAPWSRCSNECGDGQQIRRVLCPSGGNCHVNQKPASSKQCRSFRKCGAQWVVGTWSQCEGETCHYTVPPISSRTVLCVLVHHTGLISSVVEDSRCPARDRPSSTQPCPISTAHCRSRWYTGPWKPSCPRDCRQSGDYLPAVSLRSVVCIDDRGGLSNTCTNKNKPAEAVQCSRSHCSSDRQ